MKILTISILILALTFGMMKFLSKQAEKAVKSYQEKTSIEYLLNQM